MRDSAITDVISETHVLTHVWSTVSFISAVNKWEKGEYAIKNVFLKGISATLGGGWHPEAGLRQWGEKQPIFQSWVLTRTLHDVSPPTPMHDVLIASVKYSLVVN